MTDLNKLREEFEQLPEIKTAIEGHDVYFEKEFGCYLEAEASGFYAAFVNGSWYAYKKQQAKFDLYMNDFTIAANCVKSQQKTIDALKAQLDKQNRTDFEIIEQTLELVDLLASSTNVYQRDVESNVYPFESENPRVMEWWRTSCQIQELITNTDPENCDFDEYKAMVAAAQEQSAEPLNNQMINQLLPVEYIRDEMGCWIHPEYSKYIVEKLGSPERISKQEYDALCNHFNIQTVIFYMESCVSADDWEEMMDDCDITKWDPIAPHGFFLINIGFSEDDAYAVYAREIRKYSEVA